MSVSVNIPNPMVNRSGSSEVSVSHEPLSSVLSFNVIVFIRVLGNPPRPNP